MSSAIALTGDANDKFLISNFCFLSTGFVSSGQSPEIRAFKINDDV